MVLYNDGAYAWQRMASVSPLLESADTETILQFCDDDVRNHQAHAELKHFEQFKRFLNAHPLTQQRAELDELKVLAKINPAKLIDEIVNTHKNITRYESQINNNKYRDTDELIKWQNHIARAKTRLRLFENLLQH